MLSAQSLDRNTAAASRALFRLPRTPRDILALTDAQIGGGDPAGGPRQRQGAQPAQAVRGPAGGAWRPGADRKGLMSLPGVGRKCADIVLHFTFGEATVAADTHVHRICNRTGLAAGKTEAQTADSLEKRLPDGFLRDGHLLLLTHGKTICRARTPRCDTCPLADLCEAVRIS